MKAKLRNFSLIGFAFAGSLALASSALAAKGENGVKVGVLSCNESSGWGFVFGSSRELKCVFSGDKNRTERYTGKISKFGVDIGYQRSAVLVWTVISPTVDLAPGALSGDYGGVTAGASAAVGGSANVLVGGSNKSITLQPVSITGATGLNLAAGIAAIDLQAEK
jgi:hypothetical protein